MSRPAVFDLDVYRGDSDSWRFTLWSDAAATVPLDLTGFDAAAQIRTKPGAPTILGSLVCVVELPNAVDVSLPADTSAALPVCHGAAWDLELTSTTTTRTVVAGAATITADVTVPEVVVP